MKADMTYSGLELEAITEQGLKDIQTIADLLNKYNIKVGGYDQGPFNPTLDTQDNRTYLYLGR